MTIEGILVIVAGLALLLLIRGIVRAATASATKGSTASYYSDKVKRYLEIYYPKEYAMMRKEGYGLLSRENMESAYLVPGYGATKRAKDILGYWREDRSRPPTQDTTGQDAMRAAPAEQLTTGLEPPFAERIAESLWRSALSLIHSTKQEIVISNSSTMDDRDIERELACVAYVAIDLILYRSAVATTPSTTEIRESIGNAFSEYVGRTGSDEQVTERVLEYTDIVRRSPDDLTQIGMALAGRTSRLDSPEQTVPDPEAALKASAFYHTVRVSTLELIRSLHVNSP